MFAHPIMYLPFITFVKGSLISFRTNWRHLTISCTIRDSSSCRCCMQFDALTTSIFCWILTLLRPSNYIHIPLVGLHEILHFSKKNTFCIGTTCMLTRENDLAKYPVHSLDLDSLPGSGFHTEQQVCSVSFSLQQAIFSS